MKPEDKKKLLEKQPEVFEMEISKTITSMVSSVEVSEEFQKSLHQIPENTETISWITKILEKEIVIPVLPFSTAVLGLTVVMGIFLHTLLMPTTTQTPKYELLKFTTTVAYIEDHR